jgi:hypothetical protein
MDTGYEGHELHASYECNGIAAARTLRLPMCRTYPVFSLRFVHFLASKSVAAGNRGHLR